MKVLFSQYHRILFFALLMAWCEGNIAQSFSTIEKLKEIKSGKDDTVKVKLLNEWSWKIMNMNPDTAIVVCSEALVIAEKIGWKKGIAFSCSQIGVFHHVKAQFPEALKFQLRALKIDEELGYKKGIASRLNNIGNVYKDQGDQKKALDYYFKALKIDYEIKNKVGLPGRLANIGLVKLAQLKFMEAHDYFSKSLVIAIEIDDKIRILNQLGNIGLTYDGQGDSAVKVGNKKYASSVKYPKAIEYYLQAKEVDEKLENVYGVLRHIGNIGAVYMKDEKYSVAEKYILRALKLSDSIGIIDNSKSYEQWLAELYEIMKRPEEALHHYKKYIILRDSIFSQENSKKLLRSEMNFEFEKKEAVLKEQQEKERAVAEEKDRFQKVVIGSVLGGLFLVVIFAAFVYRTLKQTRLQKHIIEEKQKEILDSIYYARRIQRALITNEKYIARKLKDLK